MVAENPHGRAWWGHRPHGDSLVEEAKGRAGTCFPMEIASVGGPNIKHVSSIPCWDRVVLFFFFVARAVARSWSMFHQRRMTEVRRG